MKLFGWELRRAGSAPRRIVGGARRPVLERSYDQLDGLGSVPIGEQVPQVEHQVLWRRLERMRAACRYVHRETGIGANADRLLRSGVLGSRLPMPSLRKSADLPEGTAERLHAAWRDWAEKPHLCDYQNEAGLLTMLGTAMGHMLADGECLFWVRDGGGTGSPVRLELIDPGRVPTYEYANSARGSIMGVKFTEEGRRENYLVGDIPLDRSRGSLYRTGTYREVPASFILHWRVPLRAHAVRGVPLLYPVVTQISSLDGFNAAAAKNAELNAARIGIIQETQGAQAFDGDTRRQPTAEERAKGVVGWVGDEKRLQAMQMPDGTSLTPWPSNFPTQAVEAFNRSISQQMAAALGLAHYALSGDSKGVNFSAGRLAHLTARNTYLRLHAHLVEQVLNPVWERFIIMSLSDGALPGLTEADFIRLTAVDWAPPPADAVDIKAQADVDETYIILGVKSRAEVIRDRGGVPEAVFAEIAEEKEKLGDVPVTGRIIQPQPPEGGEVDSGDDSEGATDADEDR